MARYISQTKTPTQKFAQPVGTARQPDLGSAIQSIGKGMGDIALADKKIEEERQQLDDMRAENFIVKGITGAGENVKREIEAGNLDAYINPEASQNSGDFFDMGDFEAMRSQLEKLPVSEKKQLELNSRIDMAERQVKTALRREHNARVVNEARENFYSIAYTSITNSGQVSEATPENVIKMIDNSGYGSAFSTREDKLNFASEVIEDSLTRMANEDPDNFVFGMNSLSEKERASLSSVLSENKIARLQYDAARAKRQQQTEVIEREQNLNDAQRQQVAEAAINAAVNSNTLGELTAGLDQTGSVAMQELANQVRDNYTPGQPVQSNPNAVRSARRSMFNQILNNKDYDIIELIGSINAPVGGITLGDWKQLYEDYQNAKTVKPYILSTVENGNEAIENIVEPVSAMVSPVDPFHDYIQNQIDEWQAGLKNELFGRAAGTEGLISPEEADEIVEKYKNNFFNSTIRKYLGKKPENIIGDKSWQRKVFGVLPFVSGDKQPEDWTDPKDRDDLISRSIALLNNPDIPEDNVQEYMEIQIRRFAEEESDEFDWVD